MTSFMSRKRISSVMRRDMTSVIKCCIYTITYNYYTSQIKFIAIVTFDVYSLAGFIDGVSALGVVIMCHLT